MTLCIVVPTMSRKINGLAYFKQTLFLNRPIFNTYKTCIYINETDLAILQSDLEGLTIIPRVNHDEKLTMFTKDTYPYWRSHLCVDFIYCMTKAVELYPECTAFMWLEDDVLLHPGFSWKNNEQFVWTANGHGATCIITEKNYLLSTILPSITQHYLEDMPLDFMYRYWVQQTRLDKTVAFHIGVESSQINCIRPQNDWKAYTNAKSQHEDELQRAQHSMK